MIGAWRRSGGGGTEATGLIRALRRWDRKALLALVLKAMRSPRTLTFLLVDSFLVPVGLRLRGVRVGRGCRFCGFPLITLAPGARITLGDGVVLNSRPDSNPAGLPHPTILAALTPGSAITIGSGTGISGASIVASSSVTVGRRVLIGAGACVWDTDFHPLDPERRRVHATRGATSAAIHIDDEAFVGARSIILKGVTIGAGAVVGGAAVVTKDVVPGTIVAGNPARVVGAVAADSAGARIS